MYAGMSFCLVLAKDNYGKMLLLLAGATTVITGILSILFFKKIIGLHWILSFYPFCIGAVEQYREMKNIKIPSFVWAVCFLLMVGFFMSGNYSSIGVRDYHARILKIMLGMVRILMLMCSGILFSILLKQLCSKIYFASQVRWLGINSAFAIIVQGIAFDAGKRFLPAQNDVLYIVISVVMELAMLFVVSFLYEKLCFLKKSSSEK